MSTRDLISAVLFVALGAAAIGIRAHYLRLGPPASPERAPVPLRKKMAEFGMPPILPRNRNEWWHLAFVTLETLTAGMMIKGMFGPTGRGARFPGEYYLLEALFAVCLFAVSWVIRRTYPDRAVLGWLTASIAFLWSFYLPSIP